MSRGSEILRLVSQRATPRFELLGYALAIVSVGAAIIVLTLMQTRWQAAAHVSILLFAVIVATRFGGTKPGLLAIALSVLGFNYLLLHMHTPVNDTSLQVLRLLSLVAVAAYVVWVTAAERRRAAAFERLHQEGLRNNEELRIENMERRRTEEELRASELKFRTLAENAPGAIFICQDDRILYCNPTASQITGYGEAELCGRSFWDTAGAESRDLVRARAEARQRGEPVPPRFELKIRTKAGEERWLDFTEGYFEVCGRPAVLGIALDITERKQAEEAVRDSQQLLVQVLATLPVGVAVTDQKGDFILSNTAVKRVWGDPLIVSGAERWVRSKGAWHGSGRTIAPSEWASVRALKTGETSLNELIDIESFAGERKTIQNSAAPIRSAEGQIVGAVIVNEDVTERVRAEEALQESADRLQHLSRRLLAVQEEERRHLSRELHDEFGQLLATVRLYLQAAKSAAGKAAQPSLDEAITLLQQAATEVRGLALELRPTLLETSGLETTLRWLAEQFQQRTGIVTEVVGHVTEASGEAAIAAFRVAQEALTNVVRHADARHVWIELSQGDGVLSLVVRDDGAGFNASKALERASERGNLGLVGMGERVQILGGSLAIDSQPGRGTRIRVALPLAEPVAMPAQHMA